MSTTPKTADTRPDSESICRALEHANIPCCHADRSGVIRYLNETWKKVYDLQGARPSLFDCISSDHQTLIDVISQRKPSEQSTIEIRWQPPQGLPRWFSWQIVYEEEHKLFFIVANELTSLKMSQNELTFARNQAKSSLDQLKQSMQIKNVFLSNISHEIRTPLYGLLGMLTLLKETSLDDQQRDYLKIMTRSATSMAEIINNVLDLSQLEANKMELLTQEIDLREMIEELVVMAASTTTSRSLELNWNVDRRLPPCIKADGVRLRQILNNLLGNAVKFTAHGEVNINVNVLYQQAGLLYIQIDVQDTGIGIAPEHLGHIFEPFTQIVSTRHLDPSSSGLGLAISKQLVDAMGGELQVESAQGRGSTFSFILPVETSHHALEEKPFFDLERYNCDHVVILTQHSKRARMLIDFFDLWNMEVHIFAEIPPLIDLLDHTQARAMIFLDVQDVSLEQFTYHLIDTSRISSMIVMIGMSDFPEPYLMHEAVHDVLVMPLRQTSLTRILKKRYPRYPHSEQLETRTIKIDHPAPEFVSEIELISHGSTPFLPVNRSALSLNKPFKTSDQLRILVAEDRSIDTHITSELIESFGYVVEVYPDGLEACEAFYDHHYDAIIMDCQMPILDGYSATMRIREYESSLNLRRTPIIGLASGEFAEEQKRALEVGMDDYITKPVDHDLLRQILEDCFSLKGERHNQSPSSETNFNPIYFAETPLLDMQRQEELLPSSDEESDFLIDLIDAYEHSTKEMLSHLAELARSWNPEISPQKLEDACQDVRESSDSIGLLRMSSCMAHLERHISGIEQDELISYLQHIDMVFQLSMHALRLSDLVVE